MMEGGKKMSDSTKHLPYCNYKIEVTLINFK